MINIETHMMSFHFPIVSTQTHKIAIFTAYNDHIIKVKT